LAFVSKFNGIKLVKGKIRIILGPNTIRILPFTSYVTNSIY